MQSEPGPLFFTIFIPTYNGQEFIQSCLESAINQDYPFYNIVILDSGSTDNTLNIISNYLNAGEKIKIEYTNQRLTIIQNWSRILDYPKNEWFTILGQDDILSLDFLSKIRLLILKNNNSFLYRSNFNLIDEDGHTIRKCKPIPEIQNANEFITKRFQSLQDSFATGYVINSEAYRHSGGINYYPDLLFADDVLWVKLSLDKPVITSPEFLFNYRFHSSSTSGTPNQDNLVEAGELYLSFLNQSGDNFFLIKRAIEKYAHYQFVPILRAYYCLAVLYYAHLGLTLPQSYLIKIRSVCKNIYTSEDVVLKNFRCQVFNILNYLPFRKPLAILIFKLYPGLMAKAKFNKPL